MTDVQVNIVKRNARAQWSRREMLHRATLMMGAVALPWWKGSLMTNRAYQSTITLQTNGNRSAALGDSITIGDGDPSIHALGGNSYFDLATFLSKQRITHGGNFGVAGEAIGNMLVRVGTVINARPELCFILGGTNDTGNAVAFATSTAQYKQIIQALLGARILPVLCTIPPRNDNTKWASISKLNAWIRGYAGKQGLACMDFYSVLVDPTTGNYQTSYNSGDGIHPSVAGATAMAQYVVTNLSPNLPCRLPTLAQSIGDTFNLVTNGLFIGDGNSDGVADNWFAYGTSVQTPSLITDAGNLLGNWQKINLTSGQRIIEGGVSASGWAVGDTVAFSARVKTSGIISGVSSFSIRLLFNDGASSANLRPINGQVNDIDGTVYMEGVIPTGTTSMTVQCVIGNNSGTGILQVGQVAVINLTALGLA